MSMKVLFPMLLAATLSAPAFAGTTEGKAPSAQQQRMKACNAQAKSQGLKGHDRKSYMSSCLKSSHEASGGNADSSASARRQ